MREDCTVCEHVHSRMCARRARGADICPKEASHNSIIGPSMPRDVNYAFRTPERSVACPRCGLSTVRFYEAEVADASVATRTLMEVDDPRHNLSSRVERAQRWLSVSTGPDQRAADWASASRRMPWGTEIKVGPVLVAETVPGRSANGMRVTAFVNKYCILHSEPRLWFYDDVERLRLSGTLPLNADGTRVMQVRRGGVRSVEIDGRFSSKLPQDGRLDVTLLASSAEGRRVVRLRLRDEWEAFAWWDAIDRELQMLHDGLPATLTARRRSLSFDSRRPHATSRRCECCQPRVKPNPPWAMDMYMQPDEVTHAARAWAPAHSVAQAVDPPWAPPLGAHLVRRPRHAVSCAAFEGHPQPFDAVRVASTVGPAPPPMAEESTGDRRRLEKLIALSLAPHGPLRSGSPTRTCPSTNAALPSYPLSSKAASSGLSVANAAQPRTMTDGGNLRAAALNGYSTSTGGGLSIAPRAGERSLLHAALEGWSARAGWLASPMMRPWPAPPMATPHPMQPLASRPPLSSQPALEPSPRWPATARSALGMGGAQRDMGLPVGLGLGVTSPRAMQASAAAARAEEIRMKEVRRGCKAGRPREIRRAGALVEAV